MSSMYLTPAARGGEENPVLLTWDGGGAARARVLHGPKEIEVEQRGASARFVIQHGVPRRQRVNKTEKSQRRDAHGDMLLCR